MPKLDPNDVQQPTAADVAASQADNTPAPATTTPSFFGGATNGTTPTNQTNVLSSGSPAFGSAPTGFGSSSTVGFGSTVPMQQNFGGTQGQYQKTDTEAFTSAIMASEGRPEEHWMKAFWRPAMGWLYMLTCFCDFVVFPVLWAMIQAMTNHQVTQQWNPITLQGAGLYHLAMGAILGIAAYGRSKEKTAGAN